MTTKILQFKLRKKIHNLGIHWDDEGSCFFCGATVDRANLMVLKRFGMWTIFSIIVVPIRAEGLSLGQWIFWGILYIYVWFLVFILWKR